MAAELVSKIVVRVEVGNHRMAATDDPVFLHLGGPSGREFRLHLAHGKTLRRSSENVFVLAPPKDPEANVSQPELNDPTQPPLERAGIESVTLWKRLEPLPNVRGMGEMDDRLLVDRVEVEIHAEGPAEPLRFARSGPIWLGLLAGQSFDLARVHGAS